MLTFVFESHAQRSGISKCVGAIRIGRILRIYGLFSNFSGFKMKNIPLNINSLLFIKKNYQYLSINTLFNNIHA